MVDLARLRSLNGKASQIVARFNRAKNKFKVPKPDSQFVKLPQNGLELRLIKKFDSTQFRNLVDMTSKESK